MSPFVFVLAFHGSPGGPMDFLPLQKAVSEIQVNTVVRPGYGVQTPVDTSQAQQVVFGYSWGGLKALEYAAANPGKVKSVVWFAPFFMEKQKSAVVYWLMKTKLTRDLIMAKKATSITEEFVEKSAAPLAAPAEYHQWAMETLANPTALATEVIEKNDLFDRTNEILAKFNSSQVPLYVIVGSEDKSFDRNQSDLYRTLRKTRETVISGAGHLVIWTNTNQVSEELKKIIQ